MLNTELLSDLFDFYGRKFQINVSGKNKITSIIGKVFAIFSVAAFIFLFFYFMLQFLKREIFSINLQHDFNMSPVNNLTDSLIMFNLFDDSARPIPSDQFFSFEVLLIDYEKIIDKNGRSSLNATQTKIPFKECNSTLMGKYKDYINAIYDTNNLYCIEPGKWNLTINGVIGDTSGFSHLSILIRKCNNLTDQCEDESTINNALGHVNLGILHYSYNIDHYNISHPNQEIFESKIFPISSEYFKRSFYYLTMNVYTTDFGWFFKEMESINFYTSGEIFTDIEMKGSSKIYPKDTIGVVSIRNSNLVTHNLRTYTKLQFIFANIGGVIQSIKLVSGIIVAFLTKYQVYEEIAKKIFKYEEEQFENFNNRSINSNNKLIKFSNKSENTELDERKTK